MEYRFDYDRFCETFNVKFDKAVDTLSLTHNQDICFKLFPYKTGKVPVIKDFGEVVNIFFRKALGVKSETVEYETLCEKLIDELDIDKEDLELFKEMLHTLFFEENEFVAKNLGLYAYQTCVNDKNAERFAYFLLNIFGIDEKIQQIIEKAIKEYSYNVIESMLIEAISISPDSLEKEVQYFPIVTDVQEKFQNDFQFMLETGMTSLEDFSNLLSVYYIYYMFQACVTLDQFCQGRRNEQVKLYYALDWEKVSKNRMCCIEGWERIQKNVNHMFSHAVTLEIINQHSLPETMLDYIRLQECINQNPENDKVIAEEIDKAEKAYVSCVGDYKKFDQIPVASGGTMTDQAVRHLFECVETQFLNTGRKGRRESYNNKFVEFCKGRWLKNRRKAGYVLNLTERDIIFLTKISIRNKEKIRLIDLYKEYEYRGFFLDHTSKEYLQDFFTKLNLIDKKSDSGDAQYVKRIL